MPLGSNLSLRRSLSSGTCLTCLLGGAGGRHAPWRSLLPYNIKSYAEGTNYGEGYRVSRYVYLSATSLCSSLVLSGEQRFVDLMRLLEIKQEHATKMSGLATLVPAQPIAIYPQKSQGRRLS